MARNWAGIKRDLYNHIHPWTINSWDDDYWFAVNQIFDQLTKMEASADDEGNHFYWEIESTRYDKDENDNPCRKRWFLRLILNGKEKFGTVTAAGCGTVQEPLSRYDVTFVM